MFLTISWNSKTPVRDVTKVGNFTTHRCFFHSITNLWRPLKNRFRPAFDKFIIDIDKPGHNILAIYLASV